MPGAFPCDAGGSNMDAGPDAGADIGVGPSVPPAYGGCAKAPTKLLPPVVPCKLLPPGTAAVARGKLLKILKYNEFQI